MLSYVIEIKSVFKKKKKMVSGIARGRVRTTTTAPESRNMAAILQKNRLTEKCSLGLP